MPKPGKILKISIFIILLMFIIIFGLYLIFKFKEDNLIILISSGITGSFLLFIAVFQILGKKDTEETKEDITDIKGRLIEVESHNVIFQKSLDDIKTGNIKRDETMYFIKSSFKHVQEIDDLCTKIDADTNDLLDEHPDLNEDIKNLLTEHNSGVSKLIRALYTRNFDDIRINYYKRQLKSNLKKSIDTSSIENEMQQLIKNDINKNICVYIEDLKLIIKIENGERRKEFIKMTSRLIDKINKRSINITEKLAA